MFAYVTKNATEFQKVSSRRLTSSASAVAEAKLLARVLLAVQPAHHVGAHAVERLAQLDRVPHELVHLAAGLVEQRSRSARTRSERLPADERDRHEALRVEPEPDLRSRPPRPSRPETTSPSRRGPAGRRAVSPACRAGRVALRHPLRVLPPERREVDDARVEPGVARPRRCAHRLAAVLAADRHRVDPGPVQLLELLEPPTRALLELGRASRSRSAARSRTGRTAAAGRSSGAREMFQSPMLRSQSSIRFLYCGGVHSTVVVARRASAAGSRRPR